MTSIEAEKRIRKFSFPDEDIKPQVLNNCFDAAAENDVINILGQAMNMPLKEFKDGQEEKLLAGNVCMFSSENQIALRKITRQMRTYRFHLIPLVLVVKKDGSDFFIETFLIKVHCFSGYSYIDTIGRIYNSFNNFLHENKFPRGTLYYPKDEKLSLNMYNKLQIDRYEVGAANAAKQETDALVGFAGIAGSIGCAFATGGMLIPFAVLSGMSVLYTTKRGIENILDASQHGISVNPFENSEARNNWFMISANLLAFASIGATARLAMASKIKGINPSQLQRILLANRVISGVSAGVNTLMAIDTVMYTVINWKQLTVQEKVTLACAVCFNARTIINFANAERLIRGKQIDGICKFFKGCSDSAVKIAGAGQEFVMTVKKFLIDNGKYLSTILLMIRKLVKNHFEVSVSDDFVHIRLFGFEYKVRNIISMPECQLRKFLKMIQGIAQTFKEAFALLREMCGDGPIANIVFKRAEQTGGTVADYGKAINQLLEIFKYVRPIIDDFSILTDTELQIGAGHRFTIASAFKTFISSGVAKGIPLLRALLALNRKEIESMNSLRKRSGTMEDMIFAFVTHESRESEEMLSKIRFLLDISEVCTEKSFRFELRPVDQIVEIESIVCITADVFYRAVYQDFLIDPKILRLFECVWGTHRKFIETVWRNTCSRPDCEDKSFEKLEILEVSLQYRSKETIENVISYVSKMECPDFSRLVAHSLFALESLDVLMHDEHITETEANRKLFSDTAPLQSRFLELTTKANEHSLDGYHTVDDGLLDAEPGKLIETIKNLASQELLRFGRVENAALYLRLYPMLRVGTEIRKFNRLIAKKKFAQEDVVNVPAGKRLIFLSNDQLKVLVGFVQGVGVFIDTIIFTDEA